MVASVNQRAFSTTRGGSQETLTMSTVVARAEKIQVQYVGYFREPVFPVLEQPGRLCQSLLRYFSVYGADIQSLRINLGVLAEAHVECLLSSVRVRVWLDRLEVFLPAVQDLKQVSGYLGSGWSTMADTDSSLVTTKHVVTLMTWVQLEKEDFRSYISRFVTTPVPDWRPTVRFEHVGKTRLDSLLLEESAEVPGGLFVRSVVGIDPAPPEVAEVIPKYLDQLAAQLASVSLDFKLRHGA